MGRLANQVMGGMRGNSIQPNMHMIQGMQTMGGYGQMNMVSKQKNYVNNAVQCPLGFTYPKGSQPGKVCLVRNRRRRRMMMMMEEDKEMQNVVDRIHEENDNDALVTKERKRQLHKYQVEEEMAKTYGFGDYKYE